MSHHHSHRHTPAAAPTETTDFDLIIVGGGLTGSALAVALADTSLKIALVDARAPTRPQDWPTQWDNRVYAISPGSADLLTEIGCWPHLSQERLQRVERMVVRGDAGGEIDFSAFETGTEELAWIVESSEMACELWTTVSRQRNVSCFCPAAPAALTVGDEQAVLTLESGQVLRGKLLVGADGRESWVRNQMGLSSQHDPYNELGVVANFRTELPHFGTAYQWFREDGVLAYLPLSGADSAAGDYRGRMMSMVWSAPEAVAQALLAESPEMLAERVASAGGNQLGRLQLMAPAAGFPLKLVRVPQVVAPRVALIGDAAHGIHPLTGHGVNLGFQDVRVLADLIRTARPVDDLGDMRLLSRYQRARKEEVVMLQSVTDAMRKLFASQAPGLAPLRNLGLSLTNRLGPLKTMLIRYAHER